MICIIVRKQKKMWNDPATRLKGKMINGKNIKEYQYFRVKPQEKIFTRMLWMALNYLAI